MKDKLFSCLFLFSCCQLNAQGELSLKMYKGNTYCLATNNKVTILQTVNGNEQQTINTEKAGFCYKVLEDLDSLYLLETVFTYLSQQIESPESNNFFSSDNPAPDDMLSTIFSKILNKPFFVWMQKDYTWKETKGLDSVFLNTYNDYKLPPDTKKYLDSVILEMVKDFTKNDADLTAVLYNSKKIIPGEVWTTGIYTEHVVPTYDSSTYYLAETGGDLIVLKGTGIVSSTTEETKEGDEITSYDLKGSNEVTVTYFKNSFWIRSASLTTELNGNTLIKNTRTGITRQVPTKISTEATIEGYKL